MEGEEDGAAKVRGWMKVHVRGGEREECSRCHVYSSAGEGGCTAGYAVTCFGSFGMLRGLQGNHRVTLLPYE